MADDADDATTALIARMLADDQGGYAYDDPYEDASDDSDYGGARKPTKKQKKRGRAVGSAAQASVLSQKPVHIAKDGPGLAGEAGKGQDANELTATGRRKRRDNGAKREVQAKGWSEEEERLFLEALELHGRDWHTAAAHVGTRNKKAFTSHAQKHFIKLCIADKPLPDKVIASGNPGGAGYTLSGLPLDPNSSSARSYGFKPEHLTRLLASQGPGAKGLLLQSGKENCDGDTDVPTSKSACPPVDREGELVATTEEGKSVPAPADVPATARGSKRKKQEAGPRVRVAEEMPPPSEPTEYARNRPRREAAGQRSKWGETSESLELVQCQEFMGPPGSGASLAQPFEVIVDSEALLVMDFHAHLSSCEVIGLLGGTWDPQRRRISVRAAYPCQRLEGSHSGTSVEMDPEAQVQVVARMEQRGLKSVGWYHSHPIFAPTPSQKDNENQRNLQVVHRCDVSGLEPCLGAIVGPYDTAMPTEASVISWFVVQSRAGELTPFTVRMSGDPAPLSLPDADLEASLKELTETLASDAGRIDFTEEWRPFRRLVDGQPAGGRLSNLSKMRLAIARHVTRQGVDLEGAAALLDRLFSHLQQSWGIAQSVREAKADAPKVQIETDKVEEQAVERGEDRAAQAAALT